MNIINQIKKKHDLPFLNRKNLRDLIIICSVFSSTIFTINALEVIFALLFLCIGSLLHVIAKGQLIRNVVLCRDGLYSMVRHPYYLANYIIDSSICFLSGNMYLIILYPFLFFWAYGPTLEKEDTYLKSVHGHFFDQYAAGTPQIFPNIRSTLNLKSLLESFSLKRITLKELARIARFWSTSLFIVFIHEAKKDGYQRIYQGYDLDTLVIFVFAFILSALSFILLTKRKQELDLIQKGYHCRSNIEKLKKVTLHIDL